MKNKNTWLCLLNCSIVLSFITALGTVSILYQKPTFSEIERRDLKEFPTFSKKNYFDGSFAESISAYLADVFPMRENFVRLAGNLTELRGIGYEDVRIHNVAINESEIIDSNTSEDNSSDVISSNSEETNLENAEAVNENKENTAEEQAIRNGAVYVYKGKAFSIYGGSSSMGEYYANCINAYQERLGEKVKIYNMLIPSSIEFGMPEKYRNMSASQTDSINNIYSHLNEKIVPVNVYDALKQHENEYIYFGTDHHWTSLGAYYAYCEFAKAAGFTPIKIEDLPKKTLENFIGTLYSQTNDQTLLNNPDHVDYYTMSYDCKVYQYVTNSPNYGRQVPLYGEYALPINSYSVFLHGDFPLTKIVTENKNGKKIAVIKESYGNAFVPFLVNNYEEIYVVDERYFQTDIISLAEINNIEEILIINNIFAANSSYHANNIRRIIDQKYVPYIPSTTEKESGSDASSESVETADSSEPLNFVEDDDDDDD